MSKGLEALKELRENVCYFAIGDYAYPRLDIIEKELKALEIIKKYVSFQEIDGDFFNYEVVDKQYVSNRSCNVITNKEYDLLKEVLK